MTTTIYKANCYNNVLCYCCLLKCQKEIIFLSTNKQWFSKQGWSKWTHKDNTPIEWKNKAIWLLERQSQWKTTKTMMMLVLLLVVVSSFLTGVVCGPSVNHWLKSVFTWYSIIESIYSNTFMYILNLYPTGKPNLLNSTCMIQNAKTNNYASYTTCKCW